LDYNAWATNIRHLISMKSFPPRIAKGLKVPVFYPGMILEGLDRRERLGRFAYDESVSLKSQIAIPRL